MNFGGFGRPERNIFFDINDFDETLSGPRERDFKRPVASIRHRRPSHQPARQRGGDGSRASTDRLRVDARTGRSGRVPHSLALHDDAARTTAFCALRTAGVDVAVIGPRRRTSQVAELQFA
jgi:Uncharacterized protein conserved in bacteria (DUF2252)